MPMPAKPGPKRLRIIREETVGSVDHLKERILRSVSMDAFRGATGWTHHKIRTVLAGDASQITEADYNHICKSMGWDPVAMLAVEAADEETARRACR